MDRQIVFPGAVPLDTDFLSIERNIMAAIGYLAQAALGSGTVADGLACLPTTPASMSVTVGPGSITTLSVVDALAFGSLPADTTDPLVKMGINLQPTAFALTAPTAAGQAVNYLIEATFSEADASAIVLPYYNAANPAQPYSGPNNSGAAQNTQRLQRVQLQLKAGAAAPTGAQLTPIVDPGWVALWGVTVIYGQTAVTASSIWAVPNAPFLSFKLPHLTPGFSRIATIGTVGASSWTVPSFVTQARFRVMGGGGGGGGGNASYSGGGGGAGGYADGVFALSPGAVIAITVGAGGAGSAPGSSGGNGLTTSVSGLLSASGGTGGGSADPASYGGAGGQGFGGAVNTIGGWGTDGLASGGSFAGAGGASALGGGGRGGVGGGQAGASPGSGGGGAYQSTGNGGAGASGLVIIEF